MTTPTPDRNVPKGVQLTLKLSQSGQPAAVVLGYKDVDLTTWTQAVADRVRDVGWRLVRNCAAAELTCTGAIVRSLDADKPFVYECGAPATPTGAGTGPLAIAAGSTLIKWTTASGSRSGKGRSFIPGLPQAAVGTDGRTVVTAHATSVAANIGFYIAGTGDWDSAVTPAVVSFKDGEARPITGGSVSSVIGIQRRRMRA